MATKIVVEIPGRDWIEASQSEIDSKWSFQVIGTLALEKLIESQIDLQPDPNLWQELEPTSTENRLFNELVRKIQNRWNFPYQADELCHCRAVSTKDVNEAVLTGALEPSLVTILTSASSACATCRPDVEKIIAHHSRLENIKSS